MRTWQVVAICAGGLIVAGAAAIQVLSPSDPGRGELDALASGRGAGISPDATLSAEDPLPSLPLGAPRPPTERTALPLSIAPNARPSRATPDDPRPARTREPEPQPAGGGAAEPAISPSSLGAAEAKPQPLYLTAIVGRGDRARALVVNRDTGESAWVRANEEAFGLRLVALDRDRAVLEGGDGPLTLALGVGAPAAKPTVPTGAEPQVPTKPTGPAGPDEVKAMLARGSGPAVEVNVEAIEE